MLIMFDVLSMKALLRENLTVCRFGIGLVAWRREFKISIDKCNAPVSSVRGI